MMSIGRVSAGNGYEYLTGAVRNDAHDYYVGAGEAPGRWTGSGCERLGLAGAVGEAEMANLFGAAAHPTTGEILSAPYRHYRTVEERITTRIEALGPDPTDDHVAAVRAEQYRIGDRAPVAGYDCTFSPVKSVSAVWALAPAAERREIEDAHDAAVDAAFGWLDSVRCTPALAATVSVISTLKGSSSPGSVTAPPVTVTRNCTRIARSRTGSGPRRRIGGGRSTAKACTGNAPGRTRSIRRRWNAN